MSEEFNDWNILFFSSSGFTGQEESEQRERVMDRLTEKNKNPTTIDFIPRRGPIIDEYGPGTVFYRNKQRRDELKRKQLLQRVSPKPNEIDAFI